MILKTSLSLDYNFTTALVCLGPLVNEASFASHGGYFAPIARSFHGLVCWQYGHVAVGARYSTMVILHAILNAP